MSSLFNLGAWFLDHWYLFHVFAAFGGLTWVAAGGSFKKVAKFFLYSAVFSVLVVMVSTFFPFIGGKDYFFRTSIQFSLIFYILWAIFQAKEKEVYARIKIVLKTPLFAAVSAFVLAYLLASIFAYDPNAAFWSNFERGEGGFQMLHYYGFFVLLALLFEKERDWLKLFKLSLWAAFFMILYGVIAQLGLASQFISPHQNDVPEGLWNRLVVARFQGSLGNPAYTAPYLLFSLFYLFYLWAISEAKDLRRKILFYAIPTAFFAFFFLLSQTRAGIIGLGVAIFAFLLYLFFVLPKWRRPLLSTFILFVLAGSLLITFRNSEFVRTLPGGRIFNISLSDQTVNTRFWTWGSAWRGFLERPILGWGPENFSAVFDKHFDPRHHVPGKNTETWFDRAHSIYFDYLAETGILGLVAYLAVFGVVLWRLVGRGGFMWREKNVAEQAALGASTKSGPYGARGSLAIGRALLFASVVGYLAQGIAIFDVLPMYVNIFLVLAFSHHYFYDTHES